MTTSQQAAAIKAAMSVGRDVAEGRLSPAALEAAAAAECRALVGQVTGPEDALWGLQGEICRGYLAAGGVPATELAEWLAVARQAEANDTDVIPDAHSGPPASTESDEQPSVGSAPPEVGAAQLYAAGFADGHDQAVNDADVAAEGDG